MGDPNTPEGDGGAAITVESRQIGQAAVVAVSGVVDMLSAPVLTDCIGMALAARPAALIIDFTSVDFLASAGLEVLVHSHRSAESHTRTAVVAAGPTTRRPITLTGIDSIVTLYRTVDEALDELAG